MSVYESSGCFTFLPALDSVRNFLAILVGVCWCDIVVLICIYWRLMKLTIYLSVWLYFKTSIYCFYWSTLDIQYYITIQVGYIVIWYLYILWNDHHDEASNNLPPYKVIIILLAILFVLYITSLWLIYFIAGDVDL